MIIFLAIFGIILKNAFGFSDQSTLNSVKLCTLSIVSSKEGYINDEIFYRKDISKKLNHDIHYGTGFFYSADKTNTKSILTNFHVVENAIKEKLKIIGCNSEVCNLLEVAMIDKKSDIAILTTKEEFNCENALSLESNPPEASKIFIFGNKFGLKNSFAFGSIGAINRQVSDTQSFHIIDVNAGDGNSGGPIFLENSTKVVGMLKSIYSAGGFSSTVFAITTNDIEKSIKKMESILQLEEQLDFNIVQEDERIYFIKNKNENGFFEKFSLQPSDEIQYIEKKPVNSKVEILYDIYEFLRDDTRLTLKVVFVSNDGNLKNTILVKYRGYTDDSI